MTNRKLLLLLIAISALMLVLLCAILWSVGSGLGRGRARDTSSAIDSVLEWARLAPFPESAQDLQVSTEGGMFTRAFRVTFTAPPEEIANWVASSPGIKDLTPKRIEPNTRKYLIEPGGGAAYAEVVVDDGMNLVTVYVYWS